MQNIGFSLLNFCSMLTEQLINLRKVRSENLKFMTDLPDRVMDCWSVTQQMIIFIGRLLKKSLDRSLFIQYRSLHGLQIALFATYLAANFGCNRLRIMPEIVFLRKQSI